MPKIPPTTVHMFLRQGPESRFEIFFTDVRYDTDLVDFEFYQAWCLEKDKPIRRNAIHKVKLHNCYDPALPPAFRHMDWNRINYIINHKRGSKEAVQLAIWYFTNGEQPISLNEEAALLVEEAFLKGKSYVPTAGELIAIICQPDERKQPLFLVFKIPEPPLEVASDIFIPPIPPVVGASFPFALAAIPLVPVVPLIPGGGDTPGDHDHPSPVPEPASLFFALTGAAGVLASRFRRNRGERRSWTTTRSR
ncbi:MAG: hypothetical protein ABFD98_00995 [Syntrophobacteraceae bacterium]|nr:hypothetical protein [Desulfobacteraceae bacterium]